MYITYEWKLCVLATLTTVVYACASIDPPQQTPDAIAESPLETTHVLSPIVHAAVLEAPVKGGTSSNVTGRSTTGLLQKIRTHFAGLFNASEGHANSTTSDLAESNRSAVLTLSEVTKYERTHNETDKLVSNGAQVRANSSLVSSPADSNASKSRLSSIVHELSSALGHIRSEIKRTFVLPRGKGYKIVSKNDTLIVARVSGKQVLIPQKNAGTTKPLRVVFHNNVLTLEIAEAGSPRTTDRTGHSTEPVPGVGAHYTFKIKRARVSVDDVFVRARRGASPEYDIFIPLRRIPESLSTSTAVSRALFRNTTSGGNVTGLHWGTGHEEDEYEFLQSQMACQRLHGSSGIRRMLCTCEKVHGDSMAARLLCVSRIADKVVQTAEYVGAPTVAARVYRSVLRCKNSRLGIRRSHDCVVNELQRRAGEASALHKKYGRSILSDGGEDAARVDQKLASEKMGPEDFVDLDEDIVSAENPNASTQILLRLVMYFAFVVGVALLAICFYDLTRQYRMYKEQSRRATDLSRLPEHAQTLYSRLISKI